MKPVCVVSKQGGAVLLLAMLFAAMLAVLAVTALRVAALELRMAGNEAFRLSAFERAEAIVSEVVQHPGSFPLDLGPGQLPCDDDDIGIPCNDAGVSYRISRQSPTLLKVFPVRESQATATGAGHFSVAVFEVSVQVDGLPQRLGRARIVQGVAVRVAAPGQ
jgi:hypothetical protein